MSPFVVLLFVVILHNLTPELGAQERLHNAVLAKLGEFPYMVLIYAELTCSGSLLTETWVLTAAHCTYPGTYRLDMIILKAGVISEHPHVGGLQNMQRRTAKSVLWHPEYKLFKHPEDGEISLNDVGLVEVSEPFVFNKYVSKIRLSATSLQFGPSNECTMIGFGRTHTREVLTLHHVKPSLINNCSIIKEHNTNEHYKGDNYVCIYGSPNQHLDIVDSGGPLICRGIQYGVAFILLEMPHPYGYENLYTTTYGYLDWIKQHVPSVTPCYNETCQL